MNSIRSYGKDAMESGPTVTCRKLMQGKDNIHHQSGKGTWVTNKWF